MWKVLVASTLVLAALQHGQSVDSVRLLLGLGASVTEVDREGNTALHWALLGTQDTAGGDIFRDYKWLLSVSVLKLNWESLPHNMGKYPPRSAADQGAEAAPETAAHRAVRGQEAEPALGHHRRLHQVTQ